MELGTVRVNLVNPPCMQATESWAGAGNAAPSTMFKAKVMHPVSVRGSNCTKSSEATLVLTNFLSHLQQAFVVDLRAQFSSAIDHGV